MTHDQLKALLFCESRGQTPFSPHAKAGIMASHIQNFVKGAKGLKLKELVPYTSKYSKEHLTYSKLQPQFKSSLDVSVQLIFDVRKTCTSSPATSNAGLLLLGPVPIATDASADHNDHCIDMRCQAWAAKKLIASFKPYFCVCRRTQPSTLTAAASSL